MNLTLQEKFDIMLETLEAIGSYERCSCGCPRGHSARIGGTPVQVWALANEALEKIGHDIKVFEYYDKPRSTYRQSSQQDSIQ
jgi:hypothetical protein